MYRDKLNDTDLISAQLARLFPWRLHGMEIDDCEEDRPRKKKATGSQRTCEQISDIEAANLVSNARRAKGSDRSLDQIADVKTANARRAKGNDRSLDQSLR